MPDNVQFNINKGRKRFYSDIKKQLVKLIKFATTLRNSHGFNSCYKCLIIKKCVDYTIINSDIVFLMIIKPSLFTD